MKFLKRYNSSLRRKMDRNFLLAFLLSTLAIFTYYQLFPPEQPVPETEKQEQVQVEQETEAAKSAVSVVAESKEQPVIQSMSAVPKKSVKVDSNLYSIEIDSQDGSLTSFLLKDYKYTLEPHFKVTKFVFSLFSGDEEEEFVWDPDRLVNLAGDVSENNKVWKVETNPNEPSVNFQVSADKIEVTNQPETLEMKAVLSNGLLETKILTFYPDTYQIDFEVKLLNRTGEQKTLQPRVNFGAGGEAISGEPLPQPKVAVSFIEDDFEKYDGDDVKDTLTIDKTLWAGLMDKYFISVAKTVDGSNFKAELTPINSFLDGKEVVVPKLTYIDTPLNLGNNQEYTRKFKIYAGPKVESKLVKFDYELRNAMDLGWFEAIARPLLAILRWLQGYVVNWGVAIILLTIIVRTAMFPLAFKSMTSMRKMQALGPKITALREKYKGNKERMNKEVMKFYGQHKVNPMGGCLPMALQIPIFIGLYQALLPAIELRHTPFFFWWSDLSAADYTLILPIMMGVSMFAQQSLTPTPTMDPTQAKIMKWMPVMMVMFFLNMPSGLVLYWVVSNIISVGQQLVFNKVVPPAPVQATEKSKGKTTTKKKGKK